MLFLGLAVLLAGGVAAAAERPLRPNRSPVSIEIWTPWSGNSRQILDELIAQFNKMYPWISVRHNFLSFGDRQKLFVAYAGGSAPDVAAVYQGGVVQQLQRSGALAPLDSYLMERQISTKSFFPAMIEPLKIDGHYWALPHAAVAFEGWVTFDRERFLQKGLPAQVPQTWSDFVQASRKLTEGREGQLIYAPYQWAPPLEMTSALATSGVAWLGKDGSTLQLNGPEVRAIFDFAADYTREVYGSYGAYEAFLTAHGSSGCERALYKRAMAMVGGHVEVEMRNCGIGMEYGLGVFPYGDDPGVEERLMGGPGWNLVVSKNPDKHKEYTAYLLAEWLTADPRGGGEFMRRQGRLSPLVQVNLHTDYFKTNWNWQYQLDQMSRAAWIPSLPYIDERRNILAEAFQTALKAEKGTDAIIADALTAWRAVLQRGGQ